MNDPEFSAAARRYYKNEDERQGLQNSLKEEMPPFYFAMKQIIEDLWQRDIRFAVFNMEPNESPPKIHVGMTVCCGKEIDKAEIITDDLREEVANKIKASTKYKNVHWAL